MKHFFSTFFAVLCAIVAAMLGYGYVQRIDAWGVEKVNLLSELKTVQKRLEDNQKEVNLLNQGTLSDHDTAKVALMAQEGIKPQIAALETRLLELYDRKPLLRSSEEKQQAEQWRKWLNGYKAEQALAQ